MKPSENIKGQKPNNKESQPSYSLRNVSTFHGVRYLHSDNKIPTLAWTFIWIGNILFAIYLVVLVKNRFDKNLFYTKVDPTCRVNQVPFPAVGICNLNLISIREIRNIENILTKHNIPLDEIYDFFAALSMLNKFDYVDNSNIKHFKHIQKILRSHYFNLDIIMEEIHQKCENLLLYCSFNRRVKRCNVMFQLVKTTDGYCCIFNYAALNDASEDPNAFENDHEESFYDKRFKQIIATSESGRTSGLQVLIDVEPHDYPGWSTAICHGAKILIFDPTDYPELSMFNKYIKLGESLDLKVEPEMYGADPTIENFAIESRGCCFDQEIKLVHTDEYSYETCRTECKMKLYLSQCGCLPYYYPREGTSRICDFSDTICLKNLTISGKYKRDCICHYQCNDRSYNVNRNTMPIVVNDYPQDVINSVNTSEVMSLKVYYISSNCMCYLKKLYWDFDYLIAVFGGIIGLTMGGSIVGVFELIFIIVSYVCAVIIRYFRIT